MSKYTTGEMAKLCGVSVRTVQYYDKREILIPTELTEGGRRLYSEDDLIRLKTICFLRELDLPIDSIGELLQEENSKEVISMLLEKQERDLNCEISEKQDKLEKLKGLRKNVKANDNFSLNSVADIAVIMNNKKELKKVRRKMIGLGLIIDLLEVGTILLWILKGFWIPFVIALPIMIFMGVQISLYYYKRTAYVCPNCHKVFKPSFKKVFFSRHTPNTRKLTCHECGYHGFCVETYGGENNG